MSEKNLCREVSKLLQTMPKGGCEEILRLVSDHLSECQACRSLHADLQEMDGLLIENKAWFDEEASQSWVSTPPVRTQESAVPSRRAWRLRAVWAGAAAILLVIAGAAVFFFFDKGGHVPRTVRPPIARAPMVTRATAAASSSRTLSGVAEVLSRREAPSLGLSHVRPSLAPESFSPPFLRQCAIESGARLAGVVRSRMDVGAALTTPRGSFQPQLLQQAAVESHDTLGSILRSRINLTRRENT